MKTIEFEYKNSSLLSDNQIRTYCEQLKPEVERMRRARTEQYHTPYASINVPFDDSIAASARALAKQKKMNLQPTMLVVIGIGGSHLGAFAVHQALHGTLYNEKNPPIKIFFVDTVDPDYCADIYEIAEKELAAGGNIVLNLISKSGSTLESIANFEIFVALIQKYNNETYTDSVVVTTDTGSELLSFAQARNFSCLEIPSLVGGRYSVFSAVGLFPLAMLGVDVEQLLAGARSMVEHSTNNAQNSAAISASILVHYYKQGMDIHNTFLFGLDLEGIGRWYRQLLGESIGKEHNNAGTVVHVGITPTISLGSTDLHSVGQLYLGGPRNTITTFVMIDTFNKNIKVPHDIGYEKLVGHIQGKTLSSILRAIGHGVLRAYYKRQLPYMSIVLPEKNAYCIGQLLQMKMIEVMYVGYLLQVNPFDQPNVELYKQETREILSHE